MTCTEVFELMSAAIDGEIDQTLLLEFNRHIENCRSCRDEYELERMTKNVVRQAFAPAKMPPVLAEAIRQRLARESSEPQVREGFLSRLLQRPTRTGILAVAGVGAMLLLFVLVPSLRMHKSHAQPQDGDIVHQTFNYYDDVLNGKFTPQIASNDPAMVQAYFKTKCGCNFSVPHLRDCKLVGGMHSEFERGHTVHLVYEHNNDLVYVYETRLRDVGSGKKLLLAPEIMDELNRTGWYFDNHQPDCSLIIRLVDSTICCAVAGINKDQLLASLQ